MIPIAKPLLGQPEADAAAATVLSGWLSQGAEVAAFEAAFAAHVGAPYACAVSNCTTALHLALLAAGVGEGDEVITVSSSFVATANVVRQCGATPVFVDIQPELVQHRSGRCRSRLHTADQGRAVRPSDGHAVRSVPHPADGARARRAGHRRRCLRNRLAHPSRRRVAGNRRAPGRRRLLLVPSAQGDDDGRGRHADHAIMPTGTDVFGCGGSTA